MFCGALKRELLACKEREQTFESTVAAIKNNVPTIEFTPSGETLDANRLFLQVTGYRIEQLKGQLNADEKRMNKQREGRLLKKGKN